MDSSSSTSNSIYYQDELKRLSINKGVHRVMKFGGRQLHITESAIILSGKSRDYHEYWELCIPLDSICSIMNQKYHAEGCTYHDKQTIGIDANINGTMWNYGVKTKDPEALLRAIQRQRRILEESTKTQMEVMELISRQRSYDSHE